MYVFSSGQGEWVRRLGLGFTNPVGTGEWVCIWVAAVGVVSGVWGRV